MRRPGRSSRGMVPVVVLALVALCLAAAAAFGAGASPALAAGSSKARTTTTPSLTKSFPLGSHRLHRSTSTASRSAPTGQSSQTQPSSTPQPARAAASVTPGPSTGLWILIVLGAIAVTAVASFSVQRRVMTRAAKRSQAVGEAPIAEAGTDVVHGFGPVTFLLYQDNSGGYYWTIVDDAGEVLARSTGFASYAEANYAADIVHRAAADATFENRSGTSPPPRPLASGNRTTKADEAEPEPASGNGDSVGREEVTRRAKAAGEWPGGSSSTPGGRRR